MGEDCLFDIQPTPVAEPMSADRRRTVRQKQTIDAGGHPLGNVINGIRRHPDTKGKTYGSDGPKDRSLTCGTCIHRVLMGYHTADYPKCDVGGGIRMSHGTGTDVRAWWPACTDHEVEPTSPTVQP